MTHYQRPTVTQLQEGGTGGEVSEILFFSAKSKRRPSLIYSMQIIPVCLSIVAREKEFLQPDEWVKLDADFPPSGSASFSNLWFLSICQAVFDRM